MFLWDAANTSKIVFKNASVSSRSRSIGMQHLVHTPANDCVIYTIHMQAYYPQDYQGPGGVKRFRIPLGYPHFRIFGATISGIFYLLGENICQSLKLLRGWLLPRGVVTTFRAMWRKNSARFRAIHAAKIDQDARRVGPSLIHTSLLLLWTLI